VTEGTARNDRKNTVYDILKELKTAGFITLQKNADGSVVYEVHDEPQQDQEPDPNIWEQGQTSRKCSKNEPDPKKPDQAIPDQEKPDQAFWDVILNTERQPNTDVLPNTHPLPTAATDTTDGAGAPAAEREGGGGFAAQRECKAPDRPPVPVNTTSSSHKAGSEGAVAPEPVEAIPKAASGG